MELDYLDDPEFQELIRQYVQYLTDAFSEVKEYLNQANFLKIQKFGHNLKGSGGGYGLMGISEIGQQIEEASKAQNKSFISELFIQFEVELKAAQKKYPTE
ncbi:MAG: Hpt domain-containing protein [Candidatus Marinimicrobia bacterium]|nr:Hpt domain-containing protein [Candidatus Neomarinimicrobiota bacterium]